MGCPSLPSSVPAPLQAAGVPPRFPPSSFTPLHPPLSFLLFLSITPSSYPSVPSDPLISVFHSLGCGTPLFLSFPPSSSPPPPTSLLPPFLFLLLPLPFLPLALSLVHSLTFTSSCSSFCWFRTCVTGPGTVYVHPCRVGFTFSFSTPLLALRVIILTHRI